MATDTAVVAAPATREVLAAHDQHTWRLYKEACHDPSASPEQRRELFEDAMDALEALGKFDQVVR